MDTDSTLIGDGDGENDVDDFGDDPNDTLYDIIQDDHPTGGWSYGQSDKTNLDDIAEASEYAEQRTANPYYPFKSFDDFQTASWLIRSRVSKSEIDKFCKLKLVSPTVRHPGDTESSCLRLNAAADWEGVSPILQKLDGST